MSFGYANPVVQINALADRGLVSPTNNGLHRTLDTM